MYATRGTAAPRAVLGAEGCSRPQCHDVTWGVGGLLLGSPSRGRFWAAVMGSVPDVGLHQRHRHQLPAVGVRWLQPGAVVILLM